MRKISLWARQNPERARFSIVIIHILITVSGILAGKNLQELGIQASGFLFCTTLLLFISGVLYYPGKKQKNKYPVTFNFYRRQKTCDWMLAFSTFTVACFISNVPGNPFIFSGILKGAAITAITPAPVVTVDKGKIPSLNLKPTRAERKALIKELKKLLRESFQKQKGKDKNHASRIALVILTIVGGVLLTGLLAGLACNVACNGSETAAVFVLFFGAAGIAGLMILTIRAIFKYYPKNTDPEAVGDGLNKFR
ncbi:MAG: hypothetical protein ABIN89_07065 [Chitinophagaceae bacterium]